MKTAVLMILLSVLVFAGPQSAATAGDSASEGLASAIAERPNQEEGLASAIAEHMYFRRTSDVTQRTPVRAAFQAELKERETASQNEFRSMRLRDALRLRTSNENYAYADALEEVESFVAGMTTEQDVMRWVGEPLEVVHADIVPWSTTSGRIAYHINRDYYPEPRHNQKIIAKKFYFKEANGPQKGMSLEVLFTVNKDTGLIDNRQCYFGTGDILPLWRANVITNG